MANDSTILPAQLISLAVDDLIASQNADGGWPYHVGQPSNLEPTSLALLALHATGLGDAQITKGIDWLGNLQRPDGYLPTSAIVPDPHWATALAGLAAYHRSADALANNARDALLDTSVFTFQSLTRSVFGYNTGISGWPWTVSDFSFVEPTAMSVLFLKSAGQGQATRVRQGVDLLRDREIPGGGWNYGEPRVLDGNLFATTIPTAQTLLAMADEQNDQTNRGRDLLLSQRGELTSLMSLGWAAIALNVYGVINASWRADVAALWCTTSIDRRGPMETALALLGVLDTNNHPMALS